MLLLNLHHPVRIAEEAAVLDVLSHGRLTLGVAVGYREIEFAAFGVDPRTRGRRFDESLEIIQLVWSGAPFSYRGEIFDLPEVVVRPLSVQRPGIPLWIGGTSPAALQRAARHASPCFPGATASLRDIAAIMRRFEALGAVDPVGTRGLIVPRLALVADTRQEARARAHPAIRYMFETYQSWGVPIDFGPYLADWRLLDELVIVGDEAYCAEQVASYAELGTTDLMLQFGLPTLPAELASESQARFPRVPEV